MNASKYEPTLCVGADVHLDEIVLRAVDKALGHEVLERFRVTNRLEAYRAPTRPRPLSPIRRKTWATPASRLAGSRPACCGSLSTAT